MDKKSPVKKAKTSSPTKKPGKAPAAKETPSPLGSISVGILSLFLVNCTSRGALSQPVTPQKSASQNAHVNSPS